MYFVAFKILIFMMIYEIAASKYYYKKIDGTYDVYYGPRAIWGYKEFKSPKSYKVEFEDRGDRPGKCSPGSFFCKEPFQVKETELFECDLDYQCPSYFKCCQVTCFRHKICQPAITEDDEDNEIPTDDSIIEKSTEASTKLSTVISTSSITESVTEKSSTLIIENSSEISSTMSASSENTTSFIPQNTTPQTEKSVAYTTETSSESPSTLSSLKSTNLTPKTSLKPDIATTEFETTVFSATATNTTFKPQETTLETKATETHSKTTSTLSKSSDFTTNVNENEDITTDDEDLNFSGDASTIDEETDDSTISTKTTTVLITTSSLKLSTPSASSAEVIKGSTATLTNSSLIEQEITEESPKISTLQPTSSWGSNFTATNKRETSATVPKVSTLHPFTATQEFQPEYTTVIPVITPLSTEQFSATTELPSPILNTTESRKRTTQLVDITDDDEELTFSDDYEVSTDGVSITPEISSWVRDQIKRFSSSVADENTTRTTSSDSSTRMSTRSITSQGITASEGINSTRIKDTVTDDEDLSFSGDDELDISTVDEITPTKSTSELNSKFNRTETTTAVNLLKLPSTVTIENSTNSNTQDTDYDIDDQTFNGNDQIKSTTEETEEPSFKQLDDLTRNVETSTNYDDDFLFSEDDSIQSTKIITEKQIQSTTEFATEIFTKSVSNSSLLPTTNNQPSPTLTLNTLPQKEVENQTSLFTKIMSTEQSRITTKDTSKNSDDIDLFTGETYSTPDFTNITKNDTSSTDRNDIDLFTGETYSTPDITKNDTSSTDREISSHTTFIPSETKATSDKLATETEKEFATESTTIINTKNNEENLPSGTGVIFANGLLGMLRKVPAMAMANNDDDADHYFNNFLTLLGKVPNLIKEADVDNDLLINDSKEHFTQYQITTETDATNS